MTYFRIYWSLDIVLEAVVDLECGVSICNDI